MQLGVVRGIGYGLWGPPEEFVPQARELGATVVRSYVYWGQVEPRPGVYDWHVVDALLGQVTTEQVWLTVSSSSMWATRTPTAFLPPSPANDVERYAAFVARLVEHCGGRVAFWQCDNEPSNTGLLWAGTAPEYVTQLAAFYEAVKSGDPGAKVVLGGCGYDVLASEPGSEPRAFFAHLLDRGRDVFDVFDVHLYGDPARVPAYVADVRAMMRDHGYDRPVVAGEYGGPILFEFPELEPLLGRVMAGGDEELAMRELYERAGELPDRLRMFLADCPPELAARRDRIACRQLVVRNVLALAAGVGTTLYWHLAPEVPAAVEPYQVMHLMFGKLALLGYDGTTLGTRTPAADTFALLARELAGATAAIGLAGAVSVERAGRPPLLVVWDPRDAFDGEDQPPVPVTVPWSAPGATAVDAFGVAREVEVDDATLRILVDDTPVLVVPTG